MLGPLALVLSLVVEMRAVGTGPRQSLLSGERANATLVTYHKTGTVLAKGVNDHCFVGMGIQFNPDGELRLPAVHFVRDPSALVRSAFDYHKMAGESEAWLHERSRPKPWIDHDHRLRDTVLPNESYQEYLNRVPFFLGIRAEFLRCARILRAMEANADKCTKHPRLCKQVCLEHFTQSSESFQETWSAILQFLGVNASRLDCVKTHDLLSPKFIGHVDQHVTHATEFQAGVVDEYFSKFDDEYMNNSFLGLADGLGCKSLSLRRTPYAEASMEAYIAQQYQ